MNEVFRRFPAQYLLISTIMFVQLLLAVFASYWAHAAELPLAILLMWLVGVIVNYGAVRLFVSLRPSIRPAQQKIVWPAIACFAGVLYLLFLIWFVRRDPSTVSLLVWLPVVVLAIAAIGLSFPAERVLNILSRRANERAWARRLKVGYTGGRPGLRGFASDVGNLQAVAKDKNLRSALGDLKLAFHAHFDPRFYQLRPLPEVVELVGACVTDVTVSGGANLASCTRLFPPILIYDLVRFLKEYGTRFRDSVDLRISVTNEWLTIGTNISGGDLWFILPEGSAAQSAKMELVASLNRTAAQYDLAMEIDKNSKNFLDVRIRLNTPQSVDLIEWSEIEQQLGSDFSLLTETPYSQGTCRLYANATQVIKVNRGNAAIGKSLSLEEEALILQELVGIRGVPTNPRFERREGYQTLSMDRFDGVALDVYLKEHPGRAVWYRCFADLSTILSTMHARGIVHRDLYARNVLVNSNGQAQLIDFDQATTGASGAENVDFVRTESNSRDIPPAWATLDCLLTELKIRDEYNEAVEKMRRAWKIAAASDASSPNAEIAYYDFQFGPEHFRGERPWRDRWNIIAPAITEDVRGQRVVELGCNMALLGLHCKLAGAREVVCVDHSPSILEAGKLLAESAGVSIEFLHGDLNAVSFCEQLIECRPDVLIAFSVVHWLNDLAGVESLFRSVRTLYFEGHGKQSEEITWLKQLGFGQAKVLGFTERLRPILVAQR
jgi:predicted Ser/Thr protein kinase